MHNIKYYAIYDLDDNYIDMCLNYKELSKWFGKTIRCMQSCVCDFSKKKINSILNNNDHKKYKVYKYVDLQD